MLLSSSAASSTFANSEGEPVYDFVGGFLVERNRDEQGTRASDAWYFLVTPLPIVWCGAKSGDSRYSLKFPLSPVSESLEDGTHEPWPDGEGLLAAEFVARSVRRRPAWLAFVVVITGATKSSSSTQEVEDVYLISVSRSMPFFLRVLGRNSGVSVLDVRVFADVSAGVTGFINSSSSGTPGSMIRSARIRPENLDKVSSLGTREIR
jgi:hypothetical protein